MGEHVSRRDVLPLDVFRSANPNCIFFRRHGILIHQIRVSKHYCKSQTLKLLVILTGKLHMQTHRFIEEMLIYFGLKYVHFLSISPRMLEKPRR